MSYGMYISAAGANVQAQRLEVLSNNLANVDTTGFRREFAVLKARPSEAIETGEDYFDSHSMNDIGGGTSVADVMTDFSRGSVRTTGNKTDFAIDGDGFFVVERNGAPHLTRSGNFSFSNNGQLETQQGYPVLTVDGSPIRIDPNLPWEFTEEGNIVQGGAQIPLGIVRPQFVADLAKAGENMFQPLGPFSAVEPNQRHVLRGQLEHSAVKPASEMMELIETSRAYEANVRMVQNHDQMLNALINRGLKQS